MKIPKFRRLVGPPGIDDDFRRKIHQDYERIGQGWWPDQLSDYLLSRYQVDISAKYAGRIIKNPFGKASGQLTMNREQIQESAEAGLGFAVLKTVIAQSESGDQSMSAWSIPESKMVVEKIKGKTGRMGWTVTWKGRGWSKSFEEYLELCRSSFDISMETGMFIAPSVKFHLPGTMDEPWNFSEYEYTLNALKQVWHGSGSEMPFSIEKDFSPTLAGDRRGSQEGLIRRWLTEITRVIRNTTSEPFILGIKLFNFVGEIEFQNEMINLCTQDSCKPDFLVYANRMFDPEKSFEGHVGVAYGGPDLSDRNLSVLAKCWSQTKRSNIEISGTGDVDSGKTALEYGLLGCSSIQMHTIFQRPTDIPASSGLTRTRRTLGSLIFHPEHGLIVWLLHARRHWGLCDSSGVSKWMELKELGIQLHEVAD